MARIHFLGAKRCGVDPRLGENVGEGHCGLLHARIKGGTTIGEVKRFTTFTRRQNADFSGCNFRYPLAAFARHLAIGVAAFFQGCQRLLQRRRKAAVINQKASHVHDAINVFNHHWARFFACTAGGARPQFGVGDGFSNQRRALLWRHDVTQNWISRISCIARFDTQHTR